MDETFSDIFSVQETNIVEPKKKKKMDKILLIQISLLIVWLVLTILIYFFGYDLFSSFIKV